MNCDLPELEIVRICAGVWPEAEKSARIAELAGRGVDWEQVFEAARKHGLLFLLYKGLKAHEAGRVPNDFLEGLKRLYLQNSAGNLWMSARLVKILGVLEGAGIQAVPFKGPVQAEAVYGDIGVRSFVDLDILVRRADAIKARDVLGAKEFSADVPVADDQVEAYLAHENFFSFSDASGSLHIDLHWEMTGLYGLCPMYLEDLEDRLEKIEMAGAAVPALGAGDRLLYLCIHSSSHMWDKLEYVCAAAKIVASGKITDWDGLVKRADRLKCKKMLYLGLLLAEDLLGADLPPAVKSWIAGQRFVRRVKEKIKDGVLHPEAQGAGGLSWRFAPMHFLIRDRWTDTLRYGARMFFRPTVREWIEYSLPRRWLFLYYLLRPWRIVSGFFKS